MPDQTDSCALGPDGKLLDASEIPWYNDPDDPHPTIPPPSTVESAVQEGNVVNFIKFNDYSLLVFLSEQRSRPIRASAGTRLAEAIAAEKLDEYGSSCRRFIRPRDAKSSAKRKRPITDGGDELLGGAAGAIQVDSDAEDKSYTISVSDGADDDSPESEEDNDIEVRNDEVWLCLSSLWYMLIQILAS
jgi:hypothetical protein